MNFKFGLQPVVLAICFATVEIISIAQAQVTTLDATGLTATAATLNASVNPNGSSTGVYFNWGNTASYGNRTAVTNIGAGTSLVSVKVLLSGLSAVTNYHYQVVASNSFGISDGGDSSFSTPVFPFSMTNPVVGGGSFTFTFSGTVNGQYTIYSTTNLVDWTPVFGPFILLTNTLSLSAPATNTGHWFYQMRSP